jgi:hypothetical protein
LYLEWSNLKILNSQQIHLRNRIIGSFVNQKYL